jgi:hypothetical protein
MRKHIARVLFDGGIGGFIAYSLISAYFAVLNVAGGKSALHTLQTLSHGVFASSDPGQMIAFNGIHLLAFLMLGIVAALMVEEIELRPAFWYVVFVIAFVGFMLGYVLLSLATAALANLSPITVAFGNLVASVGMGVFLFCRHLYMGSALNDR